MAIVLALFSALCYGVSDFVGGLVSRRVSAWAVAVVGQSSAVICTAVAAVFAAGTASGADFAWAALGGIGSGVGTGFLYRGFSSGRMAVVAPISAVGSAFVPVLAGFAGGERPGALVWLGIVLAGPAIWLVSATPSRVGRSRAVFAAGAVDGVLAGLGLGGLLAALGQIPDGAGLWPLTLTQLVTVPTLVAVATMLRASWVPRSRAVRPALLTGPLGAAATLLFLLAAQRGYLTITGVLASLYPAATVLLAARVLKEHVHRAQALGLVMCAVSVTLVVAG